MVENTRNFITYFFVALIRLFERNFNFQSSKDTFCWFKAFESVKQIEFLGFDRSKFIICSRFILELHSVKNFCVFSRFRMTYKTFGLNLWLKSIFLPCFNRDNSRFNNLPLLFKGCKLVITVNSRVIHSAAIFGFCINSYA